MILLIHLLKIREKLVKMNILKIENTCKKQPFLKKINPKTTFFKKG